MIGRAGQNRYGTVDLFGQHDPYKLVRPDGRPEGEHQIGCRQHAAIMSVRTPDAEHHFAATAITPLAQFAGEIRRFEGLAALIKQYEFHIRAKAFGQGPAFVHLCLEIAIINLGFGHRTEAYTAPRNRASIDVIIDELAFRAGTDTPDRCHAQLHSDGRVCRRCRGLRIDRPHLLQIVEGAHFGTEEMDDDIASINQYPVTGLQSLDARLDAAGFL